MAKQKFKLTLTNVGLIALIIIISAFIFTSSPPAFTGAATTTITTTPVTKTVTKTANAVFSDKITIDFGKEYKNVVQVYVEGKPGGEFCKARISVQPYTSSGFISTYTLYTGAVDTHKTATKTFPFSEPGIAIRKVVGKPISAGDANAVNCGLIDYMKVTLTYNE